MRPRRPGGNSNGRNHTLGLARPGRGEHKDVSLRPDLHPAREMTSRERTSLSGLQIPADPRRHQHEGGGFAGSWGLHGVRSGYRFSKSETWPDPGTTLIGPELGVHQSVRGRASQISNSSSTTRASRRDPPLRSRSAFRRTAGSRSTRDGPR